MELDKDLLELERGGYSNNIFKYLLALDHEEWIPLTKLCKEKTKHYFVTTVKWYITVHKDVEFNSDYTKLRKIL